MSSGFALMPWLHWAQLTNFLPLVTLCRDSADTASEFWLDPMGSLVKQFPCFLLFLNFSCSIKTTTVTALRIIKWSECYNGKRHYLESHHARHRAEVPDGGIRHGQVVRRNRQLTTTVAFQTSTCQSEKSNAFCLYLRDELTFPFQTLAVSYPRRWQSGPWMPSHNCCCRRSSRIHLRFCCGPSLPGSERCDTSCKAPAPWFSFGLKQQNAIQTRQTWKKPSAVKPWRFSYLFVLLQALRVAQSFGFVVNLQQQRLHVTVGAAVGATGHGQVVQRTETRKADVAADLVDVAVKNHLVFALREEMRMKKKSVCCKTSALGVSENQSKQQTITFPFKFWIQWTKSSNYKIDTEDTK